MKASEQERFEKALIEERDRLNAALDNLHAENPGVDEEETADLGTLDSHLADAGAVTLDREIDYTLEESVELRLQAVASALERIGQGTYGRCEICAAEVSTERLEALPWATLCIDCKRREERG